MNQAQLIATIAAVTKQDKTTVETVLKALGDVAQAELMAGGEVVTLPGIGKLSIKHKDARKGRNPSTGEEIDIAAKNVPHFTAAKVLKDAVA